MLAEPRYPQNLICAMALHHRTPPRLLLIYNEMIPIRWSPGASFFAEKIVLLSEQMHETNRLVRGKIHVPPPNDELQTLSGAPVGPVHVAKVFGKAMNYLFTLGATKLSAATVCHRCLGKFVTGRAQHQSP